MGFWDDLAANSDLTKAGQTKRMNDLLIQKQILENEQLNKQSQQPTNLEGIFQTGDSGKLIAEGNLRKLFGVPQGPLPQDQTQAVDVIRNAVPDLETKTGIPNVLGKVPFSVAKDAMALQSAAKKEDPYAKNAEWDRRFQMQSERMEQQARERERKRQEDQDKKDEAKRLFVSPKTGTDFKNLNDQIKLASDIKTGLEFAISKGLDVTGILASPINKLKETLGRLPKDEQDIITDLRLNFADFVRERGGTAFTETEKEVFGPIMPELNKDEKTNLNRITKMLARLEEKKANFSEQFPGLQKQGGGDGGDFGVELKDALDAITKGADKKAVKERISQKFPRQVNLINAAMK